MEHEHGQDGEFVEVKVGYVEAFNASLDHLTQMQYRGDMPRGTMSFEMSKKYGVKIFIHTNDHLPAHFHVCCREHSPAFYIKTGERVKGHKGLEKVENQIKEIWCRGRYEILDHWNNLRPDDRPHERITAPDSWPPRDSEEFKVFPFSREKAENWIDNAPRT